MTADDSASRNTDIGRLVGDALDGVTSVVQDIHVRITRRWRPVLAAVGIRSEPVHQVHEGITGITYASIRLGMKAAPRAAAVAANTVAARRGQEAWSAADPEPDPAGAANGSAGGRAAVATLNGIWGDTLAGDYPALAYELSLRSAGRDLSPTRDELRRVYPDARDRVVLFVHGLARSENDWLPEEPAAGQADFGRGLARELGITPLYLRYNSGRHISDNGRELAELLGALAREWPVPLRGISLVGHSMGGLVIHSAIGTGSGSGHAWTSRVEHVVTLGTPHLGSPVEKGVNLADWLLSVFPESEPIARVLRSRSTGVKDLRYGAVHESDWSGTDLDELLTDRTGIVTLHPHARYHHVAATLTDNPNHPVGNLLGDALVRVSSASGPARAAGPDPGAGPDVVQVGKMSHLGLLSSPEVYQHLLGWLSESP